MSQAMILNVVVLFSLVLLHGYYSAKITKPLQQLAHATKNIENENLNRRITLQSGDELEGLAHSLNRVMESLQQAREGREQLEKAKSEFLSITGHELRSPMTPVKAQLQLLMGGYLGKLSKKQIEHLQIVLRNIDGLNSILNDYLEIARIDTGRLKFNYTKTNLKEPLEKLMKEMRTFKPEKNVKLSCNLDNLPLVRVDLEKLLRILKNLITNAIKFSSPNENVTLTVTHSQTSIQFKVEDSGIGIDSLNKEVVFDPFFQEDHKLNREYEGSGLGLTIVKGLVNAQGGKIRISSKKNKGTVVLFTLPKQPAKKPVAVPVIIPLRKGGRRK